MTPTVVRGNVALHVAVPKSHHRRGHLPNSPVEMPAEMYNLFTPYLRAVASVLDSPSPRLRGRRFQSGYGNIRWHADYPQPEPTWTTRFRYMASDNLVPVEWIERLALGDRLLGGG